MAMSANKGYTGDVEQWSLDEIQFGLFVSRLLEPNSS